MTPGADEPGGETVGAGSAVRVPTSERTTAIWPAGGGVDEIGLVLACARRSVAKPRTIESATVACAADVKLNEAPPAPTPVLEPVVSAPSIVSSINWAVVVPPMIELVMFTAFESSPVMWMTLLDTKAATPDSESPVEDALIVLLCITRLAPGDPKVVNRPVTPVSAESWITVEKPPGEMITAAPVPVAGAVTVSRWSVTAEVVGPGPMFTGLKAVEVVSIAEFVIAPPACIATVVESERRRTPSAVALSTMWSARAPPDTSKKVPPGPEPEPSRWTFGHTTPPVWSVYCPITWTLPPLATFAIVSAVASVPHGAICVQATPVPP